MICARCNTENSEGRRFCGGCGAPLPSACPACGFLNAEGIKFCGGCGKSLGEEPSGAPPAERPEPASGPSAPRAAEGERRQATILFSDLAGYTAMNERLDPEEVEGFMSRIKAEAVGIVERHGGIVNQFVGDEVVALFGVPAAHEDDPRRAVSAALALHELVRGISAEVEGRIGGPLRMHTGVNTGLIVTHLSDDREGRYGITGDAVNTGARLASGAAPDEILLSPETRRLVAPYFETEARDSLDMKGKAEPMIPWRVVGATLAQTRFEAAQRRGLTRYVGRDRELETLREAFREAAEGRGQAVVLIGEAGLGKSRLIYEFRHELDNEAINIVLGHCTATGENRSYFPFQDLLRRLYAIRDADTPAQMLKKTEESALALDPAMEEHLPALLHLLSIPSERSFPPAMAGEAIKRKIEAAMKANLVAGCRDKPLLMIFEDLHWVDENSAALIQQFVEAIVAQKVLLVMSYRPEFRPPWGHYGHLTPLALKPLAEGATGEILASTLKVETLPEGLMALVHARTEGNPFFTEEVALSLEEEGLVARENGRAVLTRPVTEIRFPDTVQAIVRARIDRLAEAPRETLRLAAVVGREFTESLVARLSEADALVSPHLAELKTLEMILEKRFQPELEFMFKHAITHQVAYDSLLLRRRRALHKLVGLAIEELYAERLPEFYEMLAHHFEQGEVWGKAVEYLVKAGIKTRQNFALRAALEFFDRAKEILEKETPAVEWEVRYHLFLLRAQTLGEFGQMLRATQEIEPAVEIARKEGNRDSWAQAMITRAMLAMMGHQTKEALRILDELEPVLADNPEQLLAVVAMQAIVNGVSYSLVTTLEKERKMNELFREVPESPYVVSVSAFIGHLSRWRGDYKKTIEILEPMLPRMKEMSPANTYLHGLFFYGLALGETGRLQEAIHVLKDGREFGINLGEGYSTPKVTNSIGWAYHELCQYQKAIHYNQLSLKLVRETFGPGTSKLYEIESQAKLNLGENYLALGDLQQAADFLESVYEKREHPDYFFVRTRWKSRCLLDMGQLELRRGNPAKAQALLGELREDGWSEKFSFKKYQVRAGRLQGNIFSAQGRDKEAEAEFKKALKLAEELGNPTQLWRTRQALGNFFQKQGKAKQAQTQYRASLKVVEGIAQNLTDPELNEGFLNSAPIREVFAQAKG